MKKVVISIFLVLIVAVGYSQISVDSVEIITDPYLLFDASNISDDTTHWFKVQGKTPLKVMVDFTYLSNSTTTLNIFTAENRSDSLHYVTVDGYIAANLPVTLSKATYYDTSESDTINIFGVYQDYWIDDYVGVKIDPPVGGTTGTYSVLIKR